MVQKMTNKRKMVLIVDDEPDIITSLQITLEDNGFQVESFNDPILALENFRKRSYSLLILDINMPKMNGFELYTKIKKIDDKVRVCFFTALAELQEYASFRKEVFPEEGKRYFIQKPVRNEEVVRMVNTITMG
jgi:two-component system catabolic regulation response regulator CreB/two-component system response regulator ChvI